MKRNPVYSPRAKSEQNGYKNWMMSWNEVADMYKPTETKQEKFNRIFQVEDAKLVK